MKKFTSILLTLVLACGVLLAMPFSANAVFEDAISATPITLDTQATAVIPWRGEAYFSFTPTESGLYRFYSDYTGSSFDPLGRLYDMNLNILAHDFISDGNYCLFYRLEAGKAYYFGASLDNPRILTTRYSVFLTKVKEITSIEVIDNRKPVLTENVDGLWRWSYDYDMELFEYDFPMHYLTLLITYEDGSSMEEDRGWRDFRLETGYWLSLESDQSSNPWEPGAHSFILYARMGGTDDIQTSFDIMIKNFADAVAGCPALNLNTATTVVPQAYGTIFFSFTPAESGSYRFYTKSGSDRFYSEALEFAVPFINLYDAKGDRVYYYFSSEYMIYDLEAGETYYYAVSSDGNNTGSFSLYVEEYTPPIVTPLMHFLTRVLEFFLVIWGWFSYFIWFWRLPI